MEEDGDSCSNNIDNKCTDDDLEATQKARAFLRDRFLYIITKLSGQPCDVKMYENTEVSCIFKAMDPNCQEIVVNNLKTPLPQVLESAILRMNDVISLEFEIPKELLY